MWFLCRRASVRAFVMQRPLLGPQKTGARTALRRTQPHCADASFLPVAFPLESPNLLFPVCF